MRKVFYMGTVLLLSFQFGLAGTVGKVAGTIMSKNNEPMIGANIMLVGTDYGTASMEDGSYFILNIPPGKYTIRYMMIGFKTQIHTDITVKADFTTTIDAIMEIQVLQSGEVVIVTATRPLIQKDATSKIKIVDADEIANLPIDDFKDILTSQAGFTTDANNEIHVRGGRSGEIQYMVDGIIMTDPIQGGYDGTVNQNGIQEMSIISGAFNAEYGNAMSSIVNIITKEGSDKLSGKFEFISDLFNESKYHSKGAFEEVEDEGVGDYKYEYIDLGDSLLNTYENSPTGYYPNSLLPLLNIPIKGKLNFNLGGKIPITNTYFFLSGLYSERDSPLPHGVNIRQDVQIKLTQKLSPTFKFTGIVHSSNYLYQNYSHSWKYLPTHNTHTFKTNDRYSLALNHSINQSLYYSASFSHTNIKSKTSTQGKLPDELAKPIYDGSFGFAIRGDQDAYIENYSSQNSVKSDLTYQLNKRHQFRTGMTYNQYNLEILNIDQPWETGTNFKDDSTFAPIEGSFYIQDKIEYDFLIINIGIRYDRLNPVVSMWKDVERFIVWNESTQLYESAPIEVVDAKAKWSPRIGIAYPVTDNTVFHFSYGHFFQSPNFQSIYYNSARDVSSILPLVGNPKLEAQKTVTFETGLKQTLSENSVLEISAWMKDIRDLLSTEQIRYKSTQYILYTNSDYASVKGFDISYSLHSRLFRSSFNYTYSLAKGNNSTPMGGYFSAYTLEEVPHEEFFLSFDQRHDIAFDLNASWPKNGSGIINYFMKNTNISFLVNAASGLPYTPYFDVGARVDQNSERMPWTYTADLRIKKSIKIGSTSIAAFFEVNNLTNHENVLSVYSRTGDPFYRGFSGIAGSLDYDYNPAHLGALRSFKLGTYINW